MLKKHFILINAILFLIAIGILILISPNLHLNQDFIGHLYKAKQQSLTQYLQGWNLNFWGGYSEDIYPSGYHYLLHLLLLVLPDGRATQALTFAIISLQVYAVISIAKAWFPKSPLHQQLWIPIILFIYMTLASQFLGGGITGILYTGGGPAALGFVWFLLVIALLAKPIRQRKSVLYLGLLLGLSFLTHTISAIVIAGIYFCRFIQDRSSRLRLFEATLLGNLIGLPTIWITLHPYFHGSRINFPGQLISSLVPLTLTLFALIQPQTRRHPLIVPTIILIALSFLPTPVSDWLLTHHVSGIHFYRFYPYGLTLLSIVLLTSIKLRQIVSAVFWVPTIGAVVLAGYCAYAYTNNATLTIDQAALAPINGRLLDTNVDASLFGVPHALQYELTNGTTLLGSENLFFESSPYGILYYSLKNILVPGSFYKGIDIRFLRKLADVPRYQLDPIKAADLLGINYLILTRPEKIATPSADTTLVGTLQKKADNVDLQAFIYLKKISATPLIVSLKTLPTTQSTSFVSWWPQASIDNIFRMPGGTDPAFDQWVATHTLDFSQPQVTNVHIDHNSFSYQVTPKNADTWVPIVAKFTYSPYFIATANGQAVPIAQVSPGFMLIPSQGQVTITWHTPIILAVIEKLSLTSLLFTIIIAATTYSNSRYRKST